MTRIFENDDVNTRRMLDKYRMLLAMVGRLEPTVWRQAANAAIARIGEVGGCKTFDEAAALIARTSNNDMRTKAAIESARQLREEAVALGAKEQYTEATEKAASATHPPEVRNGVPLRREAGNCVAAR